MSRVQSFVFTERHREHRAELERGQRLRSSNLADARSVSNRRIVCAIIPNPFALILNIILVHNRRLHVFPPAIVRMAATILAFVSVVFDVLAVN
ncbi:7018_t:CDS:2, partial [Acaulospora colombiana]